MFGNAKVVKLITYFAFEGIICGLLHNLNFCHSGQNLITYYMSGHDNFKSEFK